MVFLAVDPTVWENHPGSGVPGFCGNSTLNEGAACHCCGKCHELKIRPNEDVVVTSHEEAGPRIFPRNGVAAVMPASEYPA